MLSSSLGDRAVDLVGLISDILAQLLEPLRYMSLSGLFVHLEPRYLRCSWLGFELELIEANAYECDWPHQLLEEGGVEP